MSTNMTAIADLRADVAVLTAQVADLKATQPNLAYFAQEVGKLLLKFEQSITEDFHKLEEGVTRNFTDKFAGNFFRATEAITAKVVNLEDKQTKLEEMLTEHLKKYDEMLKDHRAKVSSLYKAHVEGIEKLIAKNSDPLAAQQSAVNETLAVVQGFDQHFVDLHNGHLALLQTSEQTISKAVAAVERFDEISTGTLEEVATEAQSAIKRLHDDAQHHIVTTRKRFNKVMSGFDDKLSQYPILITVMLLAMLGFFFGLFGNIAGRRLVKDNAQAMIGESVAKAEETINQRVDTKIDALKEISDRLDSIVDDAQYWDMLTANMTYEQKMAYIKLAQAEAQRQGRNLRVSAASQHEKPKR